MGLDQIIEFFVATDLDGQRPSGKTFDRLFMLLLQFYLGAA